MASFEGEGPLLPFRVNELSKSVDKLSDWRRDVDTERVQFRGDIADLQKGFDRLSDGLDGVRKTLMAFALTLAGSAVTISLSVLIATGKI